MSKSKAIRAFCLECCNGNSVEVRLCTSYGCLLHPFRMVTESVENREREGRLNRTQAITRHCRECNGEAECDFTGCPLQQFAKRTIK